jgi:hypothetical protein
LSVQTGNFPSLLKVSKVIPIPKSKDKNQIGNFRPISILPIVIKKFEILLIKRVTGFLDKYNILSDSQHRFRMNRSTTSAVLSFLNALHESMGNKTSPLGIFLDLSKAFEGVQHSILLEKLYKIGIRGKAHDCFASYLDERTQSVNVNSSDGKFLSNGLKVKLGVPQGSILGLLLYHIYINDFDCMIENLKCHITIYADDTTILVYDNNDKNVTDLRKEYLKVANYNFSCDKLLLNDYKTKLVTFQNSGTYIVEIELDNDNVVTSSGFTKF